MRALYGCAAFAFALAALAAPRAWGEVLANAGFEDPVTTDGPPFVGSWEAFTSGGGALAGNSTAMPHSGAMNLSLSIDRVDNGFAGVFQDVPNLTPGTPVTFSGFHMTPSTPLDLGVEVRIEWRNSTTNAEVSRTPNLTTPPTGQYSPFSLSSTVPAGANTARVVYAVQTFGPEPTNTGTVYIDDVSFVPEPSAGLLVLSGLGLASLWRRRSL